MNVFVAGPETTFLDKTVVSPVDELHLDLVTGRLQWLKGVELQESGAVTVESVSPVVVPTVTRSMTQGLFAVTLTFRGLEVLGVVEVRDCRCNFGSTSEASGKLRRREWTRVSVEQPPARARR